MKTLLALLLLIPSLSWGLTFKDGKQVEDEINVNTTSNIIKNKSQSLNKNNTTVKQSSVNNKDAYGLSKEIFRLGKYSQKFTLSHEMGCSKSDCGDSRQGTNVGDSQRYERTTQKRSPFIGKHWVAFSFYIPGEWSNIDPVQTILTQYKQHGIENPLWKFAINKGKFELGLGPHTRFSNLLQTYKCELLDVKELSNKWTDIMMYVDYSMKDNSDDNYEFMTVWVNGKEKCSWTDPVNQKGSDKTDFQWREAGEYAGWWTINYGLYRWPVSDYLRRNGTNYNYEFVRSSGNAFKFDWGVELPTQTIYFDEFRIGNTKESVQLDPNNPVD